MQEIERSEHYIEKEEEVGLPIQVSEVHSPGCPVNYFSWEQVDSEIEPRKIAEKRILTWN